MLSRILLALVLLPHAAAGAHAQVAAGKPPQMVRRSRQLVVVTTRDWDAVGGTLRRFERRGARGGAWSQVGAEVPVVVGRTGLAWGVGLVEAGGAEGPRKREGDGKAPAGLFLLGPAFGFAPAREASRLKLAYKPLTPATECVDDPASRHYNLVVDGDALKAADWNSSERMREVEGYRWGIVVAHNAAPPAPGLGSCIFMHVWTGPGEGTAGCTAMEQANLEALLRWLDPAARPLLLQLPEAEYSRRRAPWRLPHTSAVVVR